MYFDAAYIAKCYLNEPGADEVRRLAQTADGLASCEIGRLEFECIIRRHLREANITTREAREILADFAEDEGAGVWQWLAITANLIQGVRERVRALPRRAVLRAGDALHLGCAQDNGFHEVYTNDRRMLEGARYFGLTGRNVIKSQ